MIKYVLSGFALVSLTACTSHNAATNDDGDAKPSPQSFSTATPQGKRTAGAADERLSSTGSAVKSNKPLANSEVRQALDEAFGGDEALYDAVFVDLDNDGRSEVVAYIHGGGYCGSGGCDLAILTPGGDKYHLVGRTTVTQTPIRLLETSTHGWRDLSVGVAGGGARPGQVRLSFDGKQYPANPTVLPKSDHVDPAAGRDLIGNELHGTKIVSGR